MEIHDTKHLYHYYEKNKPPFRTLTALPFEEAKAVVCTWEDGRTGGGDGPIDEAWVNDFLHLRYERDELLREKFISIGGKPIRTAPVYFTLGANEEIKTWFKEPEWIKIPINEFDLDAVSFTYGDSFTVFSPLLYTGEEWHGKVFLYDEILKIIDKYDFPKEPNLIFVEAHVWSDEVLNKYHST